MNIYLVFIIAYMLICVIIGLFSVKSVRTADDYLVAGRKMPLFIVIGTLTAGWLGGGTIVGFASLAYRTGFGGLWWSAGGLAGAFLLIVFSKRLRAMAKYTVPDILEIRYNSTARLLGSIPVILAFTAIVGYQMKAVGYVLEVIMGINSITGLTIGAIVVISYTVMGGMFAVAYTDVAQYIAILIGLVVATPLALSAAGGFVNLKTALPPANFTITGGMTVIQALGYGLPFFMLATVDQNLYQRMFSAKDPDTAKKGAIGMFIGASIIMAMVLIISMSSRAIFPNIKPDFAVYIIAKELLPPVPGAILLVAILGVIMSTADSYLLSPATNIVKDIYVRFINQKASDKLQIKLTRILVIALGVLAYVAARWYSTVLAIAMVAYTIYGAGIFFPIVAAFFWKRVTASGAVAGIALGTFGTILWEVLKKPAGIPTIYIGAGLSLVGLVIVSLLTQHSETENPNPFINVEKNIDKEVARK